MEEKSFRSLHRPARPAAKDEERNAVTQTRPPTLVASPQSSFAEIREQLTELGWRLESASTASILPGEPELAIFVHGQDATVIHYTFNPAVVFRVLQFRGSNAEVQRLQVSRLISSIDIKRLRTLMESTEVRQVLLGLFAAEELGEIGVVEEVIRLCGHGDQRIARTAARVRNSLSDSLQRVAGQSPKEQAEHHDRSVWYSHLPQPELRKQVLRWLLRDSQTSTPGIDKQLHSALKDSDPEVRITAVLVAAKLGATTLIPAIRETDIPKTTSEGADQRDRLLYERLRQTAVGYLSMGTSGVCKNEDARTQFRKAVSGELEVRDGPTLLLYSLTTPVQLGDKPLRIPAAIEVRDGNYFLRISGLALRWVAPIPHWLGEDSARAPLPNPLRRVTPNFGFFIAEFPMNSALALWTSDPKQRVSPLATEAGPFLCGYAEAEHLCELLSQLEGVQLQLPSADQWEMAARGPDGRRYPWGNSLKESGLLQPSPWMVRNLVGRAHEFTRDVDAQEKHIVCGGHKTLACAQRQLVSGDDAGHQCAIRLVLNWSVR